MADPTQAIDSFAPAVERRRRRRSHRNLKRTNSVRRVQRIVALVFLGVVVIVASLVFAQRFTTYEPPAQVWE